MKNLFLSFAFLLALASCKHQIINAPTTGNGGNPITPPPGSGLVCFEADILPVFKSSCAKAGCHDVGSKRDDYWLDSYNAIMNYNREGIRAGRPDKSKIYEKIMDNSMPLNAPPLSADQKAKIKLWIEQGAQNTVNCGTCDTTKFLFAANVQPIIQTNCVSCHSSGDVTNNFVGLSNYNGVRNTVLNGKLLPSITWTGAFKMPKGLDKLSDCNIKVIQKWVAAGALNN